MITIYYTPITLETICKNGSEKFGANACTTMSDKPDGLFMAITQYGKTKNEAHQKLIAFLKPDTETKLIPVPANKQKGLLKKYLKSKGFETSIKTIPPSHHNSGHLTIELKCTQEEKFLKALRQVCTVGPRSAPGTYTVDPQTIKIKTSKE